ALLRFVNEEIFQRIVAVGWGKRFFVELAVNPTCRMLRLRCARDALAIRTKPLVAHREIDERRQNPFFIEAHRRAPEIPRSRSIRILFGRAEPSPMPKLPPHERTLSVPRTPLTKLAAPKPLRIAMKAEQDRTGTAREA